MTPRITSIISAVSALLVSESEEQEALVVAALAGLLENDSKRWAAVDEATAYQLLVYLFTRAYAVDPELSSVFKAQGLIVAQSIPALTRQANQEQTARSLLESLTQSPWSSATLQAVREVVLQIEDPRVRQRAIQFCFSVVSRWASEASPEWFQSAMRVLLVGVTDVWSAIRKESSKVSKAIVVQLPSLEMVDSFVDSLLAIVGKEDWRAQDGALLALATILSSICVERSPAAASVTTRTSDLIRGNVCPSATVTVYNIGDRHRGVAQLPRSFALRLKPTLYAALKHNQVSVREGAALCLVHYMEICDESTRILTFQEVMSKLNRLSSDAGAEPSTSSADTAVDSTVELLEAAEAEGLLDVLAKLVPQLPVSFLSKHWKFVFPTLERYVMHIASSVRLRSSALVLALAELSLWESSVPSQSIDLLHQMLLALAERRDDVGLCWQRLEGRLLSVDLLVGLLGKNHLWFMGVDQSFLQTPTHQSETRSRSAGTTIALSTWAVDEDEHSRLRLAASRSGSSIISRLNSQLLLKQVPATETWRRVLQGWLDQTHAAFQSSQFELRRISRQVLPGLVRLCLWCDQLALLLSGIRYADAKPRSSCKVDGWTWTSLRPLLLLVQHLQKVDGVCADTSIRIGSAYKFVIEALRSTPLSRRTSSDELEAIVARVETVVLANLIPVESPDDQAVVTSALRRCIGDVYANISPSLLHSLVSIDGSLAHDGSLDRQLSIAIVHLLPAIAARIDDLDLWRMVERVVLSWLATDDMFRWITVDKASAHESLLLAVNALLASPLAREALTGDEIGLVLRTLGSAAPIQNQTVRSSISSVLVHIYATLWKFGQRLTSAMTQSGILTRLLILDQQQRHYHSAKHSEPSVSSCEWDDWDGDSSDEKALEVRKTSLAVDEDLPPTSSPVAFAIGSVVSGEDLESLRADLRRLADTGAANYGDAAQSLAQALGHVGS